MGRKVRYASDRRRIFAAQRNYAMCQKETCEVSAAVQSYAGTHSINMPFAFAADVNLCFERVAKAIPARIGVLALASSNELSRFAMACGVSTRSSCEGPHATTQPPAMGVTSPPNILLTNVASRAGAGEER